MFPTKVLLATDGSENAFTASRMAIELANKTGSELHVVHVGAALPPIYGYMEAQHAELVDPERAEQRARRLLDEQVGRIETEGSSVAEAHLELGEADEKVVALSAQLGGRPDSGRQPRIRWAEAGLDGERLREHRSPRALPRFGGAYHRRRNKHLPDEDSACHRRLRGGDFGRPGRDRLGQQDRLGVTRRVRRAHTAGYRCFLRGAGDERGRHRGGEGESPEVLGRAG